MELPVSVFEEIQVTEEEKQKLREEIEGYKRTLEEGVFPELPHDISLIVELVGVDYDPAKYLDRAGVYSDREILEALLDGHIRIFPFVAENLKKTSYDVTLGDWFYLTDKVHNRQFYNMHNQQDVERYFGEPLQAVTNEEWCRTQFGNSFEGILPLRNIPREALIIVLNPHERILAHTHEFIGINGPGTTQMQARSTYGRNGIVVCKDAGWGDPGYVGRWTMEIQNDNNERVPLIVGSRPAQLVFYSSGETSGNYGEDGKYYRSSSLVEDIKNWQPEMMLPRAYRDEYVQPVNLEEGLEIRLRRKS